MDDVFDNAKSSIEVELELANIEWNKNVNTAILSGQREGISDGFQERLQLVFNQGLSSGFEVVKELAKTRGRLIAMQALCRRSNNVQQEISDLKEIESELVREISLSSSSTDQKFYPFIPESMESKVELIVNKANAILRFP